MTEEHYRKVEYWSCSYSEDGEEECFMRRDLEEGPRLVKPDCSNCLVCKRAHELTKMRDKKLEQMEKARVKSQRAANHFVKLQKELCEIERKRPESVLHEEVAQ